MKKKLKKKIGQLHLWLGLASGLILFIVALTGSLLVFEKEIDQFINPEFYNVTTVGTHKKSIDECTAAIQKRYAIEKINRIIVYNDPTRTMIIIGKDSEGDSQIFSVDPYTGKVLGTISQESRFFSIVLNIHRHLLMHDIGEIITGCSCLIFVFMLISGLVLWWPKKAKNLKQRLTVKWKASFKRVNWDFHSTFGFYTFLFLLIIALTGLTWSFKWFENGMYFIANGTTERPSPKVENPTKIDPQSNKTAFYQTLYRKTDSIFPYKGNIQIRMPADTINSILVLKENLEFSIPNQSSAIYFDKYTGKDIEIRPYESFSKGDKLKRLIYPIHTGSIYGYPTKILAFIVCLFAVTLPVTGLLIWLGKKKKKGKTNF
ncbi:PepSY-associated TM helix domain-containing protein [Flavobacterium gyeonganense]|uniref:PepSY-associated TM helix domain-containing protein n=1 Tax=Flavobacterium gyeonganense TaxID=1310418 RepID=A0ABV5HDC4_9FLAO|nr:PepSY-associated TM helix domain-containing protein [Flavobacterium gyeonganense]